MHPLTPILVTQHLENLRREADEVRRQKLARSSGPARLAAWRRVAGSGARMLSTSLGAVAKRLDPGESGATTDDRAHSSGAHAIST